jgi:hypothetical protein
LEPPPPHCYEVYPSQLIGHIEATTLQALILFLWPIGTVLDLIDTPLSLRIKWDTWPWGPARG